MKKNLMDYITILRPKQWIKNLLVFAALVFSISLGNIHKVLLSIGCFIAFCVLSSGIYILNDIIDRKEDKHHPDKSKRPIASGRIGIPSAAVLCIFLIGISFVISLISPLGLLLILVYYLVIHVFYSLLLKHVVILDVFCIAIGFVLRAMGGAVVIGALISPWLILCTFFVSLFLGFGKRRHELELLKEDAARHRSILGEYSAYFLDNIISVVTGATVISYALYTMAPRTVKIFGSANLIYTVPFVLYGVFRYLYLLHQKKQGGDPTSLFISDRSLQVDIVLWLLVCFFIIYIK